jgi:hypothetical protein
MVQLVHRVRKPMVAGFAAIRLGARCSELLPEVLSAVSDGRLPKRTPENWSKARLWVHARAERSGAFRRRFLDAACGRIYSG